MLAKLRVVCYNAKTKEREYGMKEKTCTFTGNRPHKLPWGDDESDYRCVAVKQRIRDVVALAIDGGYDTFITGMAKGGDTYFASIVLEFKKTKNVTLKCAIPCPDQTNGWTDEEKAKYDQIVANADEVTVLSNHYSRYCMHKRNRYMVDNSSMIIVMDFTGDGGTTSTREYAKKQGLTIVEVGL